MRIKTIISLVLAISAIISCKKASIEGKSNSGNVDIEYYTAKELNVYCQDTLVNNIIESEVYKETLIRIEVLPKKIKDGSFKINEISGIETRRVGEDSVIIRPTKIGTFTLIIIPTSNERIRKEIAIKSLPIAFKEIRLPQNIEIAANRPIRVKAETFPENATDSLMWSIEGAESIIITPVSPTECELMMKNYPLSGRSNVRLTAKSSVDNSITAGTSVIPRATYHIKGIFKNARDRYSSSMYIQVGSDYEGIGNAQVAFTFSISGFEIIENEVNGNIKKQIKRSTYTERYSHIFKDAEEIFSIPEYWTFIRKNWRGTINIEIKDIAVNDSYPYYDFSYLLESPEQNQNVWWENLPPLDVTEL